MFKTSPSTLSSMLSLASSVATLSPTIFVISFELAVVVDLTTSAKASGNGAEIATSKNPFAESLLSPVMVDRSVASDPTFLLVRLSWH